MKIFDFHLMLHIISFSAKFVIRLNLVRVLNPDKVGKTSDRLNFRIWHSLGNQAKKASGKDALYQ